MQLDEVYKQIEKLPYSSIWFTRKEIKELPHILHSDEEIYGLCSGTLDTNTWLLVCTNKRLLFLDKGMIFGLKMKEFLLNKINSISYTEGIILGKLTIEHGSSAFTVKNIEKDAVKPFSDSLRNQIEKFNENKIENEENANVEDEELLNIKKFKEYKSLFEEGIITEEQFEAKKIELLNL